MMRALRTTRWAAAAALAAVLVGGGQAARSAAQASAQIVMPEELAPLELSEVTKVVEAGVGQTMALDAESETVYMAWGRPAPGSEEQAMQVVVAHSTDGGKTFSEPVVVSAPEHSEMYVSTANPAVVQVGPEGRVYVVYTIAVDNEIKPGDTYRPQLVVSTDGGQTFSDPQPVVTAATEGIPVNFASFYMNGLLVASDGNLYYSFLDGRDYLAAIAAGKEAMPQLRVARSGDGGETWAQSALVGKPTCGCCSTVMTENDDGDLFASTRGYAKLEGSYDAVRDPIASRSTDDGKTWSEPVKISDDGFKISGCPDVAPGLASDADGTLHAAWYTGTSAHPGVYYATSEDGVHWSKPLTLLRGEWVPYADVRLVIDGQGRPWVAFEDRPGEVDRLQVVRIDPQTRAVAFSKAIPGHGPALAAGEDWALLSFEPNLTEDDAAGPTALQSVLVSGADT
ncbi:MAG: glycoside hydrolase [Nitrococcus sp.]|nr:glycoside hydrolase [Nitrococcus sp.]